MHLSLVRIVNFRNFAELVVPLAANVLMLGDNRVRYMEATRHFEEDRLANCRKSYGSVPKGIVREIQAGHRLKQRKSTKKKS